MQGGRPHEWGRRVRRHTMGPGLQVPGAKPTSGIPAAHPTQARGLLTQIPPQSPRPWPAWAAKHRALSPDRQAVMTVTSLFSETKKDAESTGPGRASPHSGVPQDPQVHTRPASPPPRSRDLPAPSPPPRGWAERRVWPQHTAGVMAKGGHWLPPLITSSTAYQTRPGPAWLQ